MPHAAPLTNEHYEILRYVSRDTHERARTVAARWKGITERQAVDSGLSADVGRYLQRLACHGLIDRDYWPTGNGACCYVLNAEGAKAIAAGDLLGQAA